MPAKNFNVKNGLYIYDFFTASAGVITANSTFTITDGESSVEFANSTGIKVANSTSNTRVTPAGISFQDGTSIATAPAASTNTDHLNAVKNVDGAGSGLDADLLDGQEGAYYLPSSSYTAADVLTKTKTVDGSGSGLDADLIDGNQLSAFTPIGQQTLWVPASAMEPRVTTAPATLNAVEIGTSLIALRTMDFATSADSFAGFAIQMPKGWDESTLVAQFVWSTDGTQTAGLDGVRWFIRAGSYASNDVLTTALGTAVGATAQDHSGTADDIMITSETTAITVAGTPGAEEWVYFEVYRHVSDIGDDLDIDARLHGVKIHYTIDTGNDS